MACKSKTHSGAKKRFSYTGSGKIKYQKNGRRHRLRTKNAKRSRRLRQAGIVEGGMEDKLRRMLPNG